MYFRCPKCKLLSNVKSSDFGTKVMCPNCNERFILDVGHLPHFDLPKMIKIRLMGDGNLGGIIVLINYGYSFPPLRTESNGKLIIAREMFNKAQRDDQTDRADFTLRRFINIEIPTINKLQRIAERRLKSGWQILGFERELFGDLDGLARALRKNNNSKIKDLSTVIDLENREEIIDLKLNIIFL